MSASEEKAVEFDMRVMTATIVAYTNQIDELRSELVKSQEQHKALCRRWKALKKQNERIRVLAARQANLEDIDNFVAVTCCKCNCRFPVAADMPRTMDNFCINCSETSEEALI